MQRGSEEKAGNIGDHVKIFRRLWFIIFDH